MKSIFRSTFLLSGLAVAGLVATGCTTSESVGPNAAANRIDMNQRAHIALQRMTTADPSLQQVMKSSYAYAVLPDVGEAALGIGVAGGNGIVYRDGHRIGTVTLNELSLGAQVGGESYSELVLFQDPPAFRRFQKGDLEWGSEASATLLKAGSAAGNRFDQGVSVYILPKSGLEVGVSLNGQKLHFHPDQQNADSSNDSNQNNGGGNNGNNS